MVKVAALHVLHTPLIFIFRKVIFPAFQDGFYIIFLGSELNNAPNPKAIEGVILHEIAHDYLDHLKADKHSCEMEREANRLVQQWGYKPRISKSL